MVPAQLPHIAGVLDPERATEIDIREVDLIVRFQLRNYNAGCTACASMTFDESLLDRPAPQQRKAPSPRHETVRSVEIDHLPSAIGKCNGSRLYGFEPAARGRWASVVHIARHRPYLHLRRDGGCAPLSRAERSVREDRGDCLKVRYGNAVTGSGEPASHLDDGILLNGEGAMSDNSVDIHSKRSSAERGTRRCRPCGLGRARGELRLGRMKPTGEYPASQPVINVTAGPLVPVATSLRAASSELADVSALYPRPRSMKSPPRPAVISASGIAYVAVRDFDIGAQTEEYIAGFAGLVLLSPNTAIAEVRNGADAGV